MSDHLPFEIQVEIIRRLPIESLIRFRSVSNPWKSLIDSSEFIANYKVHHSQSQRLLIDYPEILGSSHGLLCLYGYNELEEYCSPDSRYGIVVLWNPSIRKSVTITVPNKFPFPYQSVFGFGVCPHTNDPKIVKINYVWGNWFRRPCVPLQVEVFTLSLRTWRIPLKNLPRESIGFTGSHIVIVIDGFIYWLAFQWTVVGVYNLIISFDLTSEEFREIYLPEHLAQQPEGTLQIFKLRNSLVVVECSENVVYGVWMMDHGVPNSFTKLFNFDVPDPLLYRVLGFRENGEPMLEMDDMDENIHAKLEVYEPSSKHIKDLGIYGDVKSFVVSLFIETLILLDQQCGWFDFNT